MCLIAFAWQAHPRWPLVLIGNRDEFHARPTDAAAAHGDAPQVYGGRDREQGGGWLQVSQRGRLAAVTNVRQGPMPPRAARSRGALVHDFVRADATSAQFLAALSAQADGYGRFNLLLWEGGNLALASNHPRFQDRRAAPGVHALSNGPLDARWPKMEHARNALQHWLRDAADHDDPDTAPLFAALRDASPMPDEDLPDTGVGPERERLLSSAFIEGDLYGTRCSSVVMIGSEFIRFEEHRFGPGGFALGTSARRLPMMPPG